MKASVFAWIIVGLLYDIAQAIPDQKTVASGEFFLLDLAKFIAAIGLGKRCGLRGIDYG